MDNLPLIQVLVYTLTLWLGLYLLARGGDNRGLRYAGLGLVLYATGIGLDALGGMGVDLARWRAALYFLPALFWFGAVLPFSTQGVWAVLIMADIVGLFGVVQYWAVRRMRRAAEEPVEGEVRVLA